MKKCGVLMPIFSLPGKCDMGTFGEGAYAFVDFLAEAGQDFWQILPLLKADYSGSPYQSDSAFAIDPLYIDPYMLAKEYSLELSDIPTYTGSPRVVRRDGEWERILRKAYASSKQNPEDGFSEFAKKSSYWLDDYALFCALGESEGTYDFTLWKDEYAYRNGKALEKYEADNAEKIEFIKFVQYIANGQWTRLKSYAAQKSIRIIGDLPMYVSHASADVWAHRDMFMLDESGRPTLVAGVPPDAFTEDGQLWGNPVYDWQALEKAGYSWWLDRFRRTAELCDVVRLDHFRGFESFYAVKAGATNARKGEWLEGGGEKFFDRVNERFPSLEMIAEDLGVVTDKVRALIAHVGYPNMKVLQFGLDGNKENEHLFVNYSENCIAYTGTHDNDTMLGWYDSLSHKGRRMARRLLRKGLFENVPSVAISRLLESRAKYVVIPMQDWLSLGGEARINLPGSVGAFNWSYRLMSVPDVKLARRMRLMSEKYKRQI